MDLRVAGMLLVMCGMSSQSSCDQCDCTVSDGATDIGGVHSQTLQCLDGTIMWYNPIGALRLEIKPENTARFQTCFIIQSGKAKLKVSQEVDLSVNSKSPSARSGYTLNDNNLKTLLTTEGTSEEYCISSAKPVILYLEPEITEDLGYQKIVFQYDTTALAEEIKHQSIEDCRPCSEAEILKAYCSSDFVVVGRMDEVRHYDEHDKTKISVAVSQIIRQKGSHFARLHRDDPTLQGSISAPRKCGIIKGDGLFLITGRQRLGELRLGCAPYFTEWESIINRAELEGKMECTRD